MRPGGSQRFRQQQQQDEVWGGLTVTAVLCKHYHRTKACLSPHLHPHPHSLSLQSPWTVETVRLRPVGKMATVKQEERWRRRSLKVNSCCRSVLKLCLFIYSSSSTDHYLCLFVCLFVAPIVVEGRSTDLICVCRPTMFQFLVFFFFHLLLVFVPETYWGQCQRLRDSGQLYHSICLAPCAAASSKR